jgi:hypothetical protein
VTKPMQRLAGCAVVRAEPQLRGSHSPNGNQVQSYTAVMRGFLIFLAIAFPVVLASPHFWSLVRMETSLERVGYIHDNGVTQWASLGPLAPWPDWAIVPKDATITVRSHFEAAPGMVESGWADIRMADSAARGQIAYAQALEAEGWETSLSHFDATTPELPPKRFHQCRVEARKGARVLRLAIEESGPSSTGSLYWANGPVTSMLGGSPGTC